MSGAAVTRASFTRLSYLEAVLFRHAMTTSHRERKVTYLLSYPLNSKNKVSGLNGTKKRHSSQKLTKV